MTLSDRTLDGNDLTLTTGSRVGRGTHWETFEARTADGNSVAVRSLRGRIPETEYDRFDSLATQWRTVAHQETVRTLIDWGTDPVPWIAVEYGPGELDALAAGNSVEAALDCDLATRVELLADVCETVLSYARYGSTGYHLQIDPESVTFRNGSGGPTAVVGDWGISGLVVDPPVTPYTAPEQLEDANHAGRQTDVYRLGALGYHLVSGSAPFTDMDPPLSENIRGGIGESGLTGVPEDFVPVLRRAMSLSPADRHEGVYQFRRDVTASKPRVPSRDRVVSELPGLNDESTEDGGSVEENESTADDAKDSHDEASTSGNSDDDDTSVDPTDNVATDPPSLSTETVGKSTVIVAVVAIVLIIGATTVGVPSILGLGGGDAVGGTVYADAAGEEPVSNLTVTLEPVGTSDESADTGPEITETTDDGTFSFEDVSEGEYVLSVESTEGVRYGETSIEVPGNGSGLDIRPAEATVSGEVVDAETGEPLSADSDAGVDATIELVGENGEPIANATGGSYEFTVTDLETAYTLRVDADGYDSVERPVDSFGTQERIELESAVVTLSGQVADSWGTTIGGATVEVVVSAGERSSATTNMFGVYELTGLPPGEEYIVEVEADGYEMKSVIIDFSAGDVERDFTLNESS